MISNKNIIFLFLIASPSISIYGMDESKGKKNESFCEKLIIQSFSCCFSKPSQCKKFINTINDNNTHQGTRSRSESFAHGSQRTRGESVAYNQDFTNEGDY